MKVKRILAGFMTAAMVVTSVPVSGLGAMTALAADEAEYTYEAVDRSVLQEKATANTQQWPAAWTNDGKAAWAFDDSIDTRWHTRYQNWDSVGQEDSNDVITEEQKETLFNEGGATAWISSGFGEKILLGKIEYRGRQDNQKGQNAIGNWKLWVATTEEAPTESDWIVAAASVEAEGAEKMDAFHDGEMQTITLTTPVEATYFKLEVLGVASETLGTGDPHAVCAADISVYKAVPQTPEEPGPGPQPAEPQKAGIKMGAAESQELAGESQTLKGWAGYAVDGDNDTYWHSNYNGAAEVQPDIAGGERSSYFIALNEASDVTKVTYLPRQAGATNVNGTILKCEVYVTTDALEGMPSLADVTDVDTAGTKNAEALDIFKAEGVTWKPVAVTTFDAGNWANDSAEKEIVFPAVETGVTGIQVKVLNSGVASNGNQTDTFISGAEFNVYAQPAEVQPDEKAAAVEELKAALTDEIKTAGESDGSAYTEETWNAFKAAYDAAAAYAAENADLTDVTAEQITAAKDAVAEAFAALAEAPVVSEDERIFYPNEDGTITLTEDDIAFLNSMEGFEFSAVYRLTDAAQSSETEYAIVTLAGESGEFFTVRQRTGGTGAIAYAYKDAPEGLRFTGKAAVKMADTNWHKLSISAGKYKEDESKAYMDAWMDGVHVNGFPWSAGAATTFWKEGLMGTEGQYNQILVGKKLDSANYANPLENFPGEFQYIKFSKAADASAEAAQNTVEEKYTDALAALLGECEVLTEEAYTAESWAPFAAALTAAEAVEANKEWAIINATDALAAAKAALVETEEPGPGPQPVEPQKAGIKMGAAESQELNGESQTLKGWAGYAVDGDNNTFWHSNYNGSADVKPNIAGGERSSYFIALNEAADVTKVTYLPRQAQAANVNGTILKCEVYVTTDALEGMPSLAEVTDVATAGTKNTEALNVFKAEGVTWKKVAITTFDAGNWANDSAEKEIVFPAVEKGVTGIQVKVLNSGVATNDSRVDTFISGAEFNVYAQPAEEEDPEVVKAAQNELKAAITADIEAKAATNNQTEDGTKVYTTASWNRFKAAYDAAKELADKENLTDVTSAELNAAKEALETAAAGLEKYVPEKKEIPVNPDVTVKAPTAGQAVPTDQAKLDETQEDYMEVTDTTWTPASGTVSQYEDYAVSVTLTAKEGYYFGENAAAVLRTSEANVLTGATVSVNEDGSAMTINYTFKGEELAGPTDLDKAKEAVNNALNAADAIYAAGQKDYTDATWKVFADAYKAAKEAPADADAAKLNALAKSLNAAREKLAKKETGHKMGSWDRKKSTKKSTVLTRTCTNPDCTCKGSYKEQVTIPKTINLGSSETIEIKGSNPKLKITMETKVKKTPIITLKGKKKKRKYIAYDAKKRRIKTGIPTGKFEKSVYFRVDAGDGTRPEKVKVKLKVPAPRKKTDIVIKKTKVQNGAYYRYDFTYKHAVLQASKITVRIKNRNNKNTNSVLNRALGKPNADRYIHLSKDAIKGLKNKVEFQITVTYGKNKSGTLKYTVK